MTRATLRHAKIRLSLIMENDVATLYPIARELIVSKGFQEEDFGTGDQRFRKLAMKRCHGCGPPDAQDEEHRRDMLTYQKEPFKFSVATHICYSCVDEEMGRMRCKASARTPCLKFLWFQSTKCWFKQLMVLYHLLAVNHLWY